MSPWICVFQLYLCHSVSCKTKPIKLGDNTDLQTKTRILAPTLGQIIQPRLLFSSHKIRFLERDFSHISKNKGKKNLFVVINTNYTIHIDPFFLPKNTMHSCQKKKKKSWRKLPVYPSHHHQENKQKLCQCLWLALLLMGHNLLNIPFGLPGSKQLALALDELPILSAKLSSKSSSSASFILRVEILDVGDFCPEMLHWSSAGPVALVLNDAVIGLLGSPFDVRSALMLLGMSVTRPPDVVALACSKKRTCTTTLNGSRSFWAACVQASIDNFLQSRIRHKFFLSLLLRSGCA